MGVNFNVILENPTSCHPAPLGAKYEKRENRVDVTDRDSHWAQHVPGFGGGSSICSLSLVLVG